MEKLPHRKLRDWANRSIYKDHYPSTVMIEDGGYSIDEKGERTAFYDLADEIEINYIPRYEHEEEIKRIVEAQGNGSPHMPSSHHVIKVYAEKHGIPMEDGETISEWLDRWYIKRPLFKDGEPVQFGDEIEDDGEWRGIVREFAFCEDGTILLLDETPETICETKHDCPLTRYATMVLDADGVAYERGQKVWSIEDSEWFYVDEVKPTGLLNLKQGGLGRMVFNAAPHKFTHREPDSLEKLRDDMLRNNVDPVPSEINGWVKRLTALIERGA